MKIIVGLGNPGRGHARNRHNIGFLCLNYFARAQAIEFKHRECHARTGSGKIDGEEILLAKPGTFVNCSGKAVKGLVDKYRIALSDLLVVCDDLDLPLGKIRVRAGGGSGGHNGMKSILSALGSTDFPRVRVGIGRPVTPDGVPDFSEDAVVGYVLSGFLHQEEDAVALAVASVAEVLKCMVVQGVETAMNIFN
ncbi:MAG: aminoacyl-tRNA hydrolase [Dehalococcoidia bacterium]|nr:aminoacyl-tRNA hydrolase [Dehalococcoidia bacterium]